MRSRREITKEVSELGKIGLRNTTMCDPANITLQQRIIEILLDIRELLINKGE